MRRNGHKFNAKPTTVDGIRFASQAEARRYSELKLLEKAGEIINLELQPVFDLYAFDMSLGARLRAAARAIRSGKGDDPRRHIKIGCYRADFRYMAKTLSASENDHFVSVVEDVKGMKTPLYQWKKKHVEAQYGITITEIGRQRHKAAKAKRASTTRRSGAPK